MKNLVNDELEPSSSDNKTHSKTESNNEFYNKSGHESDNE